MEHASFKIKVCLDPLLTYKVNLSHKPERCSRRSVWHHHVSAGQRASENETDGDSSESFEVLYHKRVCVVLVAQCDSDTHTHTHTAGSSI